MVTGHCHSPAKWPDLGFGQDPLALHATAYLGMGLKDEALASLQQACENRSRFLIWLKVDPLYDTLRDDPSFQDFLRCVGLVN